MSLRARPTMDDIADRLNQGQDRFNAMERDIAAIREMVAHMQADVADTKEIVEAWTTVKNTGRALKWLGGIVAAIGAIIVATKLSITHMMR